MTDRDPVLEAWGRAEQHRLRATEILEHGGSPVELASHLSAAASQFEKAAEIIRQRAAVGKGAA